MTPQPPRRFLLAIQCTCGRVFLGSTRTGGRAREKYRRHWQAGKCGGRR